MELHLASIWEVIADAIPDETALVHAGRARSWREFDDRAARLASGLRAAGIDEGVKVALDLYNCSEYLEAFFATVKLNAVHVNVNYRYRREELRQLLEDADVEAVIVHASLADRVREIAPRLPLLRRIIAVSDPDDDPSGSEYEQLIAGHPPVERMPRAGGMFLSYTGGTTGLPKGVMYEMGGVARRSLDTRGLICGVEVDWSAGPAAAAIELRDRGERPVALPASPLMHSTGFTFCALPALTSGGAIATVGNRRFDAADTLAAIERTRATVLAIVGDAFGRPLITVLDERSADGAVCDTSTIRVICSAGVAWSADTKRRLLEYMPRARLVDACGSTEGGTYGISIVGVGDELSTARFMRAPGTMILGEGGEEAAAGEVGLIAAVTQTSGYFKHPEKTAETFRTINGQRYVVPGDLGVIEPDGSITLLGRGTSVINTGGEKVHPEEVEDVLKAIPSIVDAIVVGVPDDRLGQSVAAIVQTSSTAALSEDEVTAVVREQLAGYKAPRCVVFVDEIPRSPNGKADLTAARALAAGTAHPGDRRAASSAPRSPSGDQALR